jgi:uncharacterized protein (DUF1684 family)
MKLINVFIFLVMVSGLALQAQTNEKLTRRKYIGQVKHDRKLKDGEMKTGEHSPIADDEKQAFKKLNYYKPKTGFRKEASFERYDQATHFLMKTTTDRLPEYSLYGVVKFKHSNRSYSLNVYQNIELVKKPGYEKHLFIPFNDLTNGDETYGGGRFLDVYETGADTLIIDFNLAYNPYCAYNHKYSCPIPPEANNLELKIKAGEKKLNKTH